METRLSSQGKKEQGCLKINEYKVFQGLMSSLFLGSTGKFGFSGPTVCIILGSLFEEKNNNCEEV